MPVPVPEKGTGNFFEDEEAASTHRDHAFFCIPASTRVGGEDLVRDRRAGRAEARGATVTPLGIIDLLPTLSFVQIRLVRLT